MAFRTFCFSSLETLIVLRKNILAPVMWWEFLNHPVFQHVHSLLASFSFQLCLIKKWLDLQDFKFLWTDTQFSLLIKILFVPMMLNSQTISYYNKDFWDEFPTPSSCSEKCSFLKFLKSFLNFVRWILFFPWKELDSSAELYPV